MGAVIYPYLDTFNVIHGFVIHKHGYGYGTYTKVDDTITIESNVKKCEILIGETVIGEIPINNITYTPISVSDSHGTHDSLAIKHISTNGITVNYELMGNLGVKFPSITYTGAIYINHISVGLIETEQINALYVVDDTVTNVHDEDNSSMIVSMGVGDSAIKLVDVDMDSNTVVWSDSIEYDLKNSSVDASPITYNIALQSDDEGVYESTIDMYYSLGGKFYQIAEIIVNGESIGEDERYRGLLANFGIPDPKNYIDIVKDSDITDALPDYKIINQKSKELFLEYDNIFKYCGTYKGLINAVKYLGYDDIFFREWFIDTKTSTRKSFKVAYGNETDTIKAIPFDSRRTLKKLNNLSLVYHINKETGEYDENGTPVVKYTSDFNVKETRIKLYALREWLSKYIIGVNCKITDITAEGVYYEVFDNTINGVINNSITVTEDLSLTPIIESEFDVSNKEYTTVIPFEKDDKAILHLSVLEKAENMSTFNDFKLLTPEDLDFGKVTTSSVIHSVSDYVWKAKVSSPSTILDESMASNNLWIYDNTLRIRDVYKDNYDKSIKSVFNSTASNINVVVNKCYLRDMTDTTLIATVKQSVTVVENIEVEKIKLDPITGSVSFINDTIDREDRVYCMYDKDGNIISESLESFFISIKNNTSLSYEYIESIKAYGLVISNFTTNTGVEFIGRYILEIADGHIDIDNKYPLNDTAYLNTKIMFFYDSQHNQQQIYAYHTYYTKRMCALTADGVSVDYDMEVYYTGKYDLELQVWNKYNNLFVSESIYNYEVIGAIPKVTKYISTPDTIDECNHNPDIAMLLDNQPIFDNPVEYDVEFINEFDSVKGKEYSVTTISNSYVHRAPHNQAYVTIFDKNTHNADVVLTVDSVEDVFITENDASKQFTLLRFKQPFTHNFIKGDVISININLHQKGISAATLFNTSATVRVRHVQSDRSILVDAFIIPTHVLNMFKPSVDMCTITVDKPWRNIDNISSFRVEDSTEYDISGNKLILNFKNDGYILPYIDRNFCLRIDDFDISDIKYRWDVDKSNNIYIWNTNLKNYNSIILQDTDYDANYTYVWTMYNHGELFYRLYNNLISVKYDSNSRYDLVLEKVDKYGNIYKYICEGVIHT
ncbi:MAG: hypothetical protein ACRDD8_14250 [Bacteroidales bacterium]